MHERFTTFRNYLRTVGYDLPLVHLCTDTIDVTAALTCRGLDQAVLGFPNLLDIRMPQRQADLLRLAHEHGLAKQAEIWLLVPLMPGLGVMPIAVFPCTPKSKSNHAVFLRRVCVIDDCLAAHGLHVLTRAADGDAHQLRALKLLQHARADSIPYHGRSLYPVTGLRTAGQERTRSLRVEVPNLDGTPMPLVSPAIEMLFEGELVLKVCANSPCPPLIFYLFLRS